MKPIFSPEFSQALTTIGSKALNERCELSGEVRRTDVWSDDGLQMLSLYNEGGHNRELSDGDLHWGNVSIMASMAIETYDPYHLVEYWLLDTGSVLQIDDAKSSGRVSVVEPEIVTGLIQ